MNSFGSNNPILALVTDFGLKDAYVGQLKGVIYTHCPLTRIVDISHEVPPFNIRVGAYFLAACADHFPADTTFLAIVDPGVGSDRSIVILEAGGQRFVAPDNGLLSLISRNKPHKLWRLLTPSRTYDSNVFAGRDIIAPAVGELLAGVPISELCEPMSEGELQTVHWACAEVLNDKVRSEILYIDNFGNLILNLTIKQWTFLSNNVCLRLKFQGKEHPLCQAASYSQIPQQGMALIPGSQGYMEIAMNCGSAAACLTVNPKALVNLSQVNPELQVEITVVK